MGLYRIGKPQLKSLFTATPAASANLQIADISGLHLFHKPIAIPLDGALI
jgi:hypothetical protein